MRNVTITQEPPKVLANEEQKTRFQDWFARDFDDGSSAREPQERCWREDLRLYEGIPAKPRRDFPIPNAPNLTVPLSAIATDAVNAQMLDMIFSMDPVITVRPTYGPASDTQLTKTRVKRSRIMQRWIDHSVTRRYGFRDAVEDMLLDTCQLGTGIIYCPYERRLRKGRATTVLEEGPRMYAIAPEDCFVPGGSRSNIESPTWAALRFFHPEWLVQDKARAEKWQMGKAQDTPTQNWVRNAREALGRTSQQVSRQVKVYEIVNAFCRYDIDEDGVAEDLYAVYDRTSRTMLRVDYNPYDYRPLTKATYQKRGHLFYGIGVPEMLRMQQEAATDTLNHWLLNMIIANTRAIIATPEALPEGSKIWPNKIIRTRNPQDVNFLQMGDVYTSGPAAMQLIMGISERRVGINELSAPRPSQVMGSRTPGITALTMAQATSRRFTAPFESARNCIGGAVIQCLYREQEQLAAGNKALFEEMVGVLGASDAVELAELFRDKNFDNFYNVELTASNVSANKESDKQNALLILDRLVPIYDRAIQLEQLIVTPDLPPGMKDVARQIAEKGNELLLRVLQNFDQIRDPEQLLINFSDELDQAVVDPGGQGSSALGGLFGAFESAQAGGLGANGFSPEAGGLA